MRRAVIVCGMGFGDEGKGAATEFFTRHTGSGLTVRYSGGPQAGHNVQRADGFRHTFSQWGAGTFHGARTHIDRGMIFGPETLMAEALHLEKGGVKDPLSLLTVDPECLVVTRYHAWLNRMEELARGGARHGSCGAGVGVCQRLSLLADSLGLPVIYARDLRDKSGLRSKLRRLREYVHSVAPTIPVEVERANKGWLLPGYLDADELTDTLHRLGVLQLCYAETPPLADTGVFEGAQGILLDQHYGTAPHNTWRTVTPSRAAELCADMAPEDVLHVGCVRAVMWRHGAGPFPTECPELSSTLVDRGNMPNAWQGKIRFGWFDMPLFDYAMGVYSMTTGRPIDCLMLSHYDQYQKLGARAQWCTHHEREHLSPTLRQVLDMRTRDAIETDAADFATAFGETVRTARPVYSNAPLLAALAARHVALITSTGPTLYDRTVHADVEQRLARFTG